MSGSGSTTTQTQGPPEWLQNYGRQYLDTASGVAAQPYTPYGGQRVADLSPTQIGGIQGIADLMGGNSNLWNAQNTYDRMLTDNGQNPYASGVADRVTRSASDAYRNATGATTARFNRPGAWGGSAHAMEQGNVDRNFATGLGDALSTQFSNDYNNSQNRALQAASGSQGLYDTLGRGFQAGITAGNVDRSQYQQLLDSLYGDFQDQVKYPQQQLGIFGDALGRAMGAGGQQSTTQGPGPDRVSQGVGTLAIANMLGSGKGGTGK